MENSISSYIKTSIDEMKKVTWPTKKETSDYTILVIAISLGVSLYLGLMDFGFNKILEIVINKKA
jgi:preprotein translocase subunit SecE